IQAPRNEFGESSPEETMIATVAERLGVDPSRASRVVSEMVSAGFAERAVSQTDARRTIIRLTAAGAEVVDAGRTGKFLLLGEFLADWDEDDLSRFITLFTRFSEWTQQTDRPHSGRFEEEIRKLSEVGASTK